MIPFLPFKTNEKAQLKNIFDDDLDVSAFSKEPVALPKGETLIWDHVYQQGEPGYKVNSSDRADIELIKLYGSAKDAQLFTQLTLFFEDGTFNEYEWTSRWSHGDHVVVSGNDLLGVLKNHTLVWFRVAVTLQSGPEEIQLSRLDFFWEAGDIEKADCGLHDIIDIEGVGEVYAEKLRAVGIDTVEQLLHTGKTPENRQSLAKQTGLSLKRIDRWVDMSELWRIKGVGEEFSELLDFTGIDSLPKLAKCEPKKLLKDLIATNEERRLVRHLPSDLDVTRWVIQAKNLDPLVIK